MEWLCQTHGFVVCSDGMMAPDTTMNTRYCGSFSMICLELSSDSEKRLPSIKNGLITGRNILGSGVVRSWWQKVFESIAKDDRQRLLSSKERYHEGIKFL